jgi:hypothetical protein
MKKSLHIVIALLSLGSGFVDAGLINIEQKIYSQDNLFYTDWGHYWTQQGDGDSFIANNTDGALNDGQPAQYISYNGSPYAFNRNFIQSMTITVSGSVKDFGVNETDATGNNCYITKSCGFFDGYFHKLPVYGVIGLWSTTFNTITPVKYDDYGKAFAAGDAGYDDLVATTSAPFFIGTGGAYNFSNWIPSSVDSMYLFMAENDGIFSDNNPEQFYTANIIIQSPDPAPPTEVPEPSSVWLAGVGLTALTIMSRRRRID